MSERNDGGPAFPKIETDLTDEYGNDITHVYSYGGMTLRDYFAAKAMAGSLAGVPGGHLLPDNLARDSYAHADAMLKARDAK